MRTFPVYFLIVLLSSFGQGWAAGEQAISQRNANALAEYSPPESFLNGNFIADEVEPTFIFGKVRDFAKSRSCPTSWLIEQGERQRLQTRDPQSSQFEYTLYFEEDCPGKITYYVFVDRSLANNAQWLEWRKQFHKNKAEPQYGTAKAGLDKAARDGFPVDAELRFVEVGGNLQLQKPEDVLVNVLHIKPVYDLRQGKALVQPAL